MAGRPEEGPGRPRSRGAGGGGRGDHRSAQSSPSHTRGDAQAPPLPPPVTTASWLLGQGRAPGWEVGGVAFSPDSHFPPWTQSDHRANTLTERPLPIRRPGACEVVSSLPSEACKQGPPARCTGPGGAEVRRGSSYRISDSRSRLLLVPRLCSKDLLYTQAPWPNPPRPACESPSPMFQASRPGTEGRATSWWAPGRSAEWQSWNESVLPSLGPGPPRGIRCVLSYRQSTPI